MNEQNNGTQGQKHPLALSPAILILNIILAVLGAIIGMELIVRVGISTNTSIVGALFAIILSRIPLAIFKKYKNIMRRTWCRHRFQVQLFLRLTA